MAITEDRMLRLITAAETLRDISKGIYDALGSWREGAASGELSATQVIDAGQRYIATLLPSPYDLATIEVERRHFESNRARNAYSRRRMAAIRDPNGEGPKRAKRAGYDTRPHDPTVEAIAKARPVPMARALPQSPSARPMPRNAAELAAYTAEADRQMAADKAALAEREAHKPKPLPFAPPRSAPTNPYENDGMPDIPPGVTAEDLLRAEAQAKANGKNQNPPSNELTPEPTHAILQSSEQGAAEPPSQEPG